MSARTILLLSLVAIGIPALASASLLLTGETADESPGNPPRILLATEINADGERESNPLRKIRARLTTNAILERARIFSVLELRARSHFLERFGMRRIVVRATLPGCNNSAISMIVHNLRILPEFSRGQHLSLAPARDRWRNSEGTGRQIKYLKVENEVLRTRVPGRVYVTTKERRRLVKFAMGLPAKAVKHLVSIVHPETVLRWVRGSRKERKPGQKANSGRRRTPEQLRRLIRKMANENDWGYTRIMGELKKLGIKPPSRNTVKNILKQSGFDPGPKRGEGTWDDFLKRHAHSLCSAISQAAAY